MGVVRRRADWVVDSRPGHAVTDPAGLQGLCVLPGFGVEPAVVDPPVDDVVGHSENVPGAVGPAGDDHRPAQHVGPAGLGHLVVSQPDGDPAGRPLILPSSSHQNVTRTSPSAS